jgi:hypothetical protein
MRKLLGFALVAAVVVGLVAVGPASAAMALAAGTVLANRQMNEGPGATTMVDSSGNGINGSIGSAVQTGVVFQGATGYQWPFTSPTNPPAQPQRIIQANSASLNPTSGN